MKKPQLRIVLSLAMIVSIALTAVSISAAPIRYKEVVQVVNTKPGNAGSGNFSRLKLASRNFRLLDDDDGDEKKGDDKKKKGSDPGVPQDDRVVTITTEEITEDEVCDCTGPFIASKPFPKWPFFGLAAIPLVFIKNGSPTPTPTLTTPTTPTPMTPSPTPPPIPEPMTLLLFGTGLAGIGIAARKRFGRKEEGEGS